jgi:hypothetical protein
VQAYLSISVYVTVTILMKLNNVAVPAYCVLCQVSVTVQVFVTGPGQDVVNVATKGNDVVVKVPFNRADGDIMEKPKDMVF